MERNASSNEDMEKQLKAKVETNAKRMIANINRNKNPEVKDLEANQSTQIEHNEEFSSKYGMERAKHDELKDELI